MRGIGIGIVIAVWIIGAIPFAAVSYDESCKKKAGLNDVITAIVASSLWPVIIVGRVGIAAWSPPYAATAMGCGSREVVP